MTARRTTADHDRPAPSGPTYAPSYSLRHIRHGDLRFSFPVTPEEEEIALQAKADKQLGCYAQDVQIGTKPDNAGRAIPQEARVLHVQINDVWASKNNDPVPNVAHVPGKVMAAWLRSKQAGPLLRGAIARGDIESNPPLPAMG